MKPPIEKAGQPDPAKKSKRINSKQKGNTYERWLARFYREQFGFNFCRTSREASRLLDNCGIDLSGIPHNASAKSGYRSKRPQPDKLIAAIKEMLRQSFPASDPIHTNLTFVFHRLDGYSPFHHIVSMTFDDWVRIMTVYERFKTYENEGEVSAGGVT